MIQGSVLANEFHVRFAVVRKSVQKAHTMFQPLHKSDVLETSCKCLNRGILLLGLMVVAVICSAHLAVLSMQRCP